MVIFIYILSKLYVFGNGEYVKYYDYLLWDLGVKYVIVICYIINVLFLSYMYLERINGF